ncbi:hypothetical protein TYRP_011491 [Tyrophagus putrescentiae]|nr:hypothetical protein TYRP_011491 [Tyrophagus putrescentiae]
MMIMLMIELLVASYQPSTTTRARQLAPADLCCAGGGGGGGGSGAGSDDTDIALIEKRGSRSRRGRRGGGGGRFLEKVIGRSAGDVRLAALRRRVKLEEGVVEGVVELHDRRLVAAAVAVVGRTEDGHHVVVVAPVEALHHQLVGAGDQRQAVGVVEGLADVVAEGVAGAARADAPAAAVVRVGPKEVAHRPLVGHLLQAVEGANVVEGVDGWREAAVEAEDLTIDWWRKRKR